ncbi:hypothetical protein [Okeania sp. KiyG1]|nr:hypothetical protein [Okeania sp. KiyG1]
MTKKKVNKKVDISSKRIIGIAPSHFSYQLSVFIVQHTEITQLHQ